jgi:hypothetical protein
MPGLLRGVARTAVVAGTATAVSNRVSRRQAGRWAAQEGYRQEVAPEPAPQVQTQEDAMSAKVAQLKDLGDLRASGVLTEEEFEEQKQRILGA